MRGFSSFRYQLNVHTFNGHHPDTIDRLKRGWMGGFAKVDDVFLWLGGFAKVDNVFGLI